MASAKTRRHRDERREGNEACAGTARPGEHGSGDGGCAEQRLPAAPVTSSTVGEEARDEAERLLSAASGEVVAPDAPRARHGHGGLRLRSRPLLRGGGEPAVASSSTESSRDGAARPIRRRGSTLGWPTNGRRRPGEIHHELLLLDGDDGSQINKIGRLNEGVAPGGD